MKSRILDLKIISYIFLTKKHEAVKMCENVLFKQKSILVEINFLF